MAATAQDNDNDNWEKWFEAMVENGDLDNTALIEDMHDILDEMARQPLNINAATRENLEALPFLNSKQVMDIMEYLDFHGPMRSKTELNVIESLGFFQRQLLSCFITIGEKPKDDRLKMKDMTKYGKSEMMAYASIPTYNRKGDRNGYLGYKYKHWIRYSFSYGKRLKIGLVASQDAGEPFMAAKNKLGSDYYSPYLQVNDMGIVETIAVGRYKVGLGMGLVMNQGFYLGKLSALQSFNTLPPTAIRAHSSRSEEHYLQGAATTLRLTKNIKATAFASYRKADATLNNDSTISTITYTGYHRTEKEMEKKNNTSITVVGANASFEKNDWHIGVSAVMTHVDRLLSPNTSQTYRQIYPHGHDFANASIDYAYRRHPLLIGGETAINRKGGLATLNSANLCVTRTITLTAIYRFYSYNYHSFHSNAFSEGGKVQNESGVYAGMEWKPSYGSVVNAYIDYAYFAWPRYQVSQSSSALDVCLSSTVKTGQWTMQAKYRWRRKQKDTYDDSFKGDIKPLVWTTDQKARISAQWTDGTVEAGIQMDGCIYRYENTSRGIMLGNFAGLKLKRLSLSGTLKWFVTDDYDSRLYSYERGLLYSFSMPAKYGRGIHYSFLAKCQLWKNVTLSAKIGVADYFDRSTIGSSYQQIDASSACDIELQARVKF